MRAKYAAIRTMIVMLVLLCAMAMRCPATLLTDNFPGSGANLDLSKWTVQATSGGANGIYHPSPGVLYVVGAWAGGGPGTFAVETSVPTFQPTGGRDITLDVPVLTVADTYVGFFNATEVSSIAFRSDQGANWAVETPSQLFNTSIPVNFGGPQDLSIDWSTSSVKFSINGVSAATLSYTATTALPMFVADLTSGQDTSISSVLVSETPEPGTLALLSFGAAVLAWYRRH